MSTNPLPCAQSPAAIISISDPDRELRPDQKILRDLFGLTSAECRLTELLSQGTNLRQAAEKLGITINTAHSHLQHIFDKTRTNRQSGLMCVLNATLTGTGPSIAKRKAA